MKTILVIGKNDFIPINDYNVIILTSSMCDFNNYNQTLLTFKEMCCDMIIYFPTNIITTFEENIFKNTNIIKAAYESGIENVIVYLNEMKYNEQLISHCKMYRELFNKRYHCFIR